ncbi:hypothetical protein [Labilibaculum sp.]|uniref:hypothetical protein n=1 Tax=Labilibaculum sp. TaxID=2060723 RepID=UPI00356241AC
MKRQVLLLLFGILVFTSCNHYESKVAISSSENSEIDTNLFGEWTLTSENDKDKISGYLEVIPFNDTEYLIQLNEVADSSKYIKSILNFRMYSSVVQKNEYLNVQFIGSDSEKTFMIYRIKSISGNRYKVFYLSKEQFNIEFKDSASFYEYIEKHSKEFEKAFEVEGILERKIN